MRRVRDFEKVVCREVFFLFGKWCVKKFRVLCRTLRVRPNITTFSSGVRDRRWGLLTIQKSDSNFDHLKLRFRDNFENLIFRKWVPILNSKLENFEIRFRFGDIILKNWKFENSIPNLNRQFGNSIPVLNI